MRSSAASGRSSHARIRRPPIDVHVRSISCSSDPARPPPAASITSSVRSVVGSMTMQSAPVRNAMSRTCARSAFCVSRRYCTSAPAAHVAAGRSVSPKPWSVWACICASSVRRADSNSKVHPSASVTRVSSRSSLDERRDVGEPGGRHDLARPEDRELVRERLTSVQPGVLRRRELSGGQIEQRDAVARARMRGRDAHQKRRLARIEVAGIGQRAGRDHPHDFAPDQSLGLLRILHLLADGDTEALLDEARDVAVAGVIGDPAHRNRAAGGVFRSRGERQLQRARGRERVLVEHLVEIPHAEEDDRVAVLPLRFEILPHGRGRAGWFTKHRRERHQGELCP